MKKTYSEPEIVIERFNEDLLCTDGWDLGSPGGEGWQRFDDEADM
jgi:hypothetical protein